MSRLLLDTNRYSDLVANVGEVTSRVERAEEVWLTVISLGELRAGFALGTRRAQNEACLTQVLTLQGVGLLVPDSDTSRFYAEIVASLRRSGTPIPTNDAWIAALAIQHNLELDSRDEHFRRVTGLRFVAE
jgi:tRNA(fMet)-specific endonuclease VapC